MQYSPETEPGGSTPHAAGRLLEIDASELSPGHRLVLPDGENTAQVLEVDTVLDDYERPALYFAALDNHMNVRVAHGTSVRIAVPKPSRPADLLFAGPQEAQADDGGHVAEAGDGDGSPSRGRSQLLRRALGLADPKDDADAAGGEVAGTPTPAPWAEHAPAPAPEGTAERTAGPAAGPTGAPTADPAAKTAGHTANPARPAAPDEASIGASFLDDAAFDADAHADDRPATTITLDTGDVVVVPGKARNEASGPKAAQLRLIPQLEGHPEDLVRHIDAVHPGRHAVHELSERLSKGINPKSGACLKDLRDLAYELYLGQRDDENALKIADLLAVVPFDGNPGRWSSVESGLALAAHLARERNEEGRAAVYRELLRAPETAETDPFRARMAARVRQRTLNEPNLYDKEVTRAAEAGDDAEERNWRALRLDALLHVRAHGGSEAFDDDELDRRIRIELAAIGR